MNYSFRGFIEERFADEIKAAVEEFIEGDRLSGSVKTPVPGLPHTVRAVVKGGLTVLLNR